jgi:hypothetical protein
MIVGALRIIGPPRETMEGREGAMTTRSPAIVGKDTVEEDAAEEGMPEMGKDTRITNRREASTTDVRKEEGGRQGREKRILKGGPERTVRKASEATRRTKQSTTSIRKRRTNTKKGEITFPARGNVRRLLQSPRATATTGVAWPLNTMGKARKQNPNGLQRTPPRGGGTSKLLPRKPRMTWNTRESWRRTTRRLRRASGI